MKERQGFQKLHNNFADTSYLLSPRSFELLILLGSNSDDFHPTNHNLSQRLRISIRAVQVHLSTLERLGLIAREGKAIRRGHIRKIKLTSEAAAWLREGVVPSKLKVKVSHEATCTSEEFLKKDSSEGKQDFKKKVSHEARCTPKGNQLPKYIKEEEGHAYARPFRPSSFLEKSLIDVLEGLPLSASSKKSLARRAAQQQVLPRAMEALADKAMSQCRAKSSWTYLGAYLGKMLADGDYERAMTGVRKQAAYRYLSGFEAYLRCNRAISCHVRDLSRRMYSC
jgi:DNA-binding transcriptional ArsR family regulator